MALRLGDISLDGFEVSPQIKFGGAQKLVIHKLPGGGRVIDVMGPDDDVIAWHGILTGGDATRRARAMDELRVAGQAIPLAWDVFSAVVVVSELRLEFSNSWWVPYQIACTVVTGVSSYSGAAAGSNSLAAILADLEQSLGVPGIDTAIAAVTAAAGTASGSSLYSAALSALLGASNGLAASLTSAEAGMAAVDVQSLVTSSGALAQLTAAGGFLGRATVNFTETGF